MNKSNHRRRDVILDIVFLLPIIAVATVVLIVRAIGDQFGVAEATLALLGAFALAETAHRVHLWQVRGDLKTLATELGEAMSSMDRILDRHQTGLVEVFPNRPAGFASIMNDMADSNRIWIAGLHMNDFLCHGRPLFDSFHRATQRARGRNIRVVVMDPTSSHARQRAAAEQPTMPFDRSVVLGTFDTMWRELPQQFPTLDIRFTSLPMPIWVVLFDTCAYVEFYHFARLEAAAQFFLGGRVPLFKFAEGAALRVMEAHINELSSSNVAVDRKQLEHTLAQASHAGSRGG